MLQTPRFTVIKLLLLTVTLLSNHIIRATSEIEEGSGLDDASDISEPSVLPNDDERTLISEITCSSNKDCGERNESSHAFSYCTENKFCACMEGRTSKKGGKCKCDKKRQGTCTVIYPEVETACKRLDCGVQGTCELVQSGAYCDCKNGWRGQMCGFRAMPVEPDSDQTPSSIKSTESPKSVISTTVNSFSESTKNTTSTNVPKPSIGDKTLAFLVTGAGAIIAILVGLLCYRKHRNNEPQSIPGMGMQ